MSFSDQAPVTDALAIERERYFFDDEQREWRVRESDLPRFDRRSGRCLIFETGTAARRVRTYPNNWFALTDVELYSLSISPAPRDDAPPPERVCLFNPVDGPIVVELTPDALTTRMFHNGLEYRRHVLSLLAPSGSVEEATFYSLTPPDADHQRAIFSALFGERSGIYRVDPDAD